MTTDTTTTDAPATITGTQYNALQAAYDHFNRHLFGATLPPLLITLQRHANSRGYYAPGKFQGRSGQPDTSELALNPDTFRGRTDREILSTLVHEMVHHWQQYFGTPPRKAYHDRQWANKMIEIGLHPSDTGQPGGRETGQKITHFVVNGAAFSEACDEFFAENSGTIAWQTTAMKNPSLKNSKTKFSCPSCGQNAWGAPSLRIGCLPCTLQMEPQE